MENKKFSLEKLVFDLVNIVRKHNDEPDIEEYDNISVERKWQQLENIMKISVNSDITPEEEHKIWMKLKKKDGWKHGKKIDRENKIHDCLVPYEKLNDLQKFKDYLAIKTVLFFTGQKD